MGTYQFFTSFNSLGDMPNEFKRVMDSFLKNIPCTNSYIEDILVASKGSLDEHKSNANRVLTTLDKINIVLKREKGKSAKFCQKEIEWLGSWNFWRWSTIVGNKVDAIIILSITKIVFELRSFFGSQTQYVKLVQNLSTLSFSFVPSKK